MKLWERIKPKFAFLKNKQSVFYYFLFLFGLAFIMAIAVLLIESFTIPLGGDYVQQQIPFYTNGYDDWWHFLKTGEFPLWDSNTVLGVNNIGANSFYYFLNPFFLPILICPRSLIPQGLALLMLIKMALAGITFRLYLKNLGVEEKTARLFSIAYAFCGWNLYYMWFNHFMEVVVMFPLVLLGIDKVLKERKPFTLMISLFVLGLANYFFLVVACFAGVMYAGFRFFQTIKTRNVKENFASIGLGVFAFATGLMMCAFVLLPCLNAVTEAGRVESATYLESLKTAFSEKNLEAAWKLLFDFNSTKKRYYPLVTYFFPVMSDFHCVLYRNTGYDNTLSSLFIYTPLTIMVVPALINSIRKKKVSHIFAAGIFTLMLFTPFAYELFHGFTVDYGRWQLFVVIALIAYVAISYKDLKTYPKWYFDISVLVILFCMAFTVATAAKNQYDVYDVKETFAIVIYQFIYVIVVYFIIRFYYQKPKFEKILPIMLCIEVIVVGNMTLFGQKTTYNSLAGGPSNFKDEVKVVSNINKSDQDYFRIFNTTANDSTNNLGMREGYNGVGGFHSLYNTNIKDFLNWTRMLYWRDTWTMGSHEKKVNLDQFLSVKYYILKNSDYNTNIDSDEIVNDINMYNVPFGYKYREDLSSSTHSVFENENYIQLGYAFDNIIPVNKDSVENYMYLDNNYWPVYSAEHTRNNGAAPYSSAAVKDFMQVIRNEEALLSGAILYDVDESGFFEENSYTEETLNALKQFPINNYSANAGELFAGSDLNVRRYNCPNGVGNNAKELLDTSNGTLLATNNSTPYKYNQDKYIITLKNGSNFCSATNSRGGSCYIGLKMQLNRYAYVHLYDEDDNLITFDYHQYIGQDYKNLRGFYSSRPVKTIVVKPMIDEDDKTVMNGFAVYQEYYDTFMNSINKIKQNPLKNVKVTTNTARFTTNYTSSKIVVTTIPYDAGWSLEVTDVNGNKVQKDLFKAQGGFMAFIADPGEQSYYLSYFTPKLKQGLLISLSGFALLGISIGVNYWIERRRKASTKEKDEKVN